MCSEMHTSQVYCLMVFYTCEHLFEYPPDWDIEHILGISESAFVPLPRQRPQSSDVTTILALLTIDYFCLLMNFMYVESYNVGSLC